MGEVFLAIDNRLGRHVALKLLPAAFVQDETWRQRFLREARAASALNHPNICTIHEVGEAGDRRMYLVMEYIEGQTLDVLTRAGTLDFPAVVDAALQIAEALEVAHDKGIIHRDIKPSNICRTSRGLVKVLDFGLAKWLGESNEAQDEPTLVETQAGQLLGTPAYMSPEQARGRELDARSDLFSLGVVLYEAATGAPAFAGSSLGDTIDRILHHQPDSISSLRPGVPVDFDRIVSRCLRKDPRDRYSSAAELANALRTLKHQIERPTTDPGTVSLETPPQGSGTPALPLEELGRSDVLIACTSIDNQPLLAGQAGWVSQFSRNLEVRLEQLAGERIRVCTHPTATGLAEADLRVLQRIPDVKAMVSIVSPPFLRTGACRREVEQFWQAAHQSGTWTVDNRNRLFKVIKTPVDLDQLPEPLSGVLRQVFAYEFYETDAETGRLREFSEAFGEQARRQFLERIYDLAYEINGVVTSLKTRSATGRTVPAPMAAKAVYLAEATSDLRAERDLIRRELQERGFQVLPDAPLPLVAEELVEAIQRYLTRVEAVVHLVGARYGIVPDGASESLVQLQSRMSAEAAEAGGFVRFIWTPPGLVPGDERQSVFLQDLRESDAGMNRTELLAGSIEQLKNLVIKRLTAPPPDPKSVPPTPGPSIRRVYLLCDSLDERAVEPIEDYLYEQGIEVKIPAFDGNPDDFVRAHHENLKLCDAALIYFGHASVQWVEMKLMDLIKARGYGRRRPWSAQAVYLAPPEHRRKERFRSHAVEVVRETAGFQPELLAGFVRQLTQAPSYDSGEEGGGI